MNLDPKIAKSIVTSLKDVVNHEINLFDTTGRVVASTDASRVGTTHDAARLAAKTSQTVAVDDSGQFKGAKHGINVPVLFNGAVVAVVGMTGELDEVSSFGTIIGRMTEILIRENHDQVVRFDAMERFSNLVNLLVLKHHDHSLVDYLASVLNIDFSIPRKAVVGRRADNERMDKIGDVYPILYARLSQEPGCFFSTTEKEVRIFANREGSKLSTFVRNIHKDLENHLDAEFYFGVGDTAMSEEEYWRSYERASRALSWSLFKHEGNVRFFESMDEGIVFTAIPKDESASFVNHVFGDLSDKEIDDFQVVFDSYARHNGSITHSADELFLHKNTLQNRLNKIARMTGYNPRDLSDYAVLSMAFKLRSYLRQR